MTKLFTILVICTGLLSAGALTGCMTARPTLIAVLAADVSSTHAQPWAADILKERVAQLCDDCAVQVYDAAADGDTQDAQFDEAIGDGAALVILDPVDPERAEALTQRSEDLPVLAYATLVPGADWFVGISSPAAVATSGSAPDSDLMAARELIAGERTSFAFVPAAAMSKRAAEVAVGVLADEAVADPVDYEGVPSWLFDPAEVTVRNLTSVVVASGAMTLDDLCAGQTAQRCARLGLL